MSDQTPLPCPFCGGVHVGVKEGDTFRWRRAWCEKCGAEGPEIRIQTMGEGTRMEWEAQAYSDAIAAWNSRR